MDQLGSREVAKFLVQREGAITIPGRVDEHASLIRNAAGHRLSFSGEYGWCPLCVAVQKREAIHRMDADFGRRTAKLERYNANLYEALSVAMEVIGANMAEHPNDLAGPGEMSFREAIRYIHGHVPSAKAFTNLGYDRAQGRFTLALPTATLNS
jgi:hypothetical protein